MKILQVAPYFPPHIGGVESHVYTMAKELIARGHVVQVVTSNYSLDLPEHEIIEGIDVVRLKPKRIAYRTPITPGLVAFIEETDADLVHAHSPPPLDSYYSAIGLRGRAVPLVLTHHCDLQIPSAVGRMVTRLYEMTRGADSVKRADRIIVTTKSYGDTSSLVWKYEPSVIPNAVNVHDYNPGIDGNHIRKKWGLAGKKVVLFVGRLAFHKGVEHLIESTKYLDDDYRVLIVGTGERSEPLQHLAKEIGMENRVIFTGKVPYSTLPTYYAACDLFCLPSVTRLEAFGIVVLEAMSTAKPVLISSIPGVRELITEGVEGLHGEPVNPRDLAAKIKMILSDPEKARVMGLAGRKKVEREYNWDHVIDLVLNVYTELTTGNSTR